MGNEPFELKGTDDLPVLETISISYIVAEDRMCIDGITASGEISRLWLTARMLNRLIPQLLRINMNPSQDQPVLDAAIDSQPEGDKVEFCPGSAEFLIESIDIRPRNGSTVLVFKENEQIPRASFILSVGALSRFTSSLRQCFIIAGWPVSPWMEFESVNTDQAEPESVTVH